AGTREIRAEGSEPGLRRWERVMATVGPTRESREPNAPTRRSLLQALPNGLSLLRLLLGLSFPWLPPAWHLPVVLVATLTDLLDGASGRLLGACSTTGRVLDPIADKVFLTSVVVTLLVERMLEVGEVVLVGLRDLAVLAGVVGGLLTRDWDAFR